MSQQVIASLSAALSALLARDEANTCQHEDTYRGGTLWEICRQCGAKWADDEGGRPAWQDPPEWEAARAALAAASSAAKPEPQWYVSELAEGRALMRAGPWLDTKALVPVYPQEPAAPTTQAPAAPAVACVTECEACFTPEACQIRGKCAHYAAEELRVAALAAQPEPMAYLASSRYGSQCHFGMRAAAEAWAGEGGEVFEIPLRHLGLVSPAAPTPQAEPATLAERERLIAARDDLRQALEVIAVGDSADPVRDAADTLVELGYWRAEAVAVIRAQAQPAQAPQAVPPGYVLAPMECTQAMADAAFVYARDSVGMSWHGCWKAMLAARPTPEAPQAVPQPLTAEQHFKFSQCELENMAKNPRVLAALMEYHEVRQTESDAFFEGDGPAGNKLRKQALYERGRSIMAEDLDIWDNDLRKAFGFPLYVAPTAQAPAAQPHPVAWIRVHPDGTYANDLLLAWEIDAVRRESGAWKPLYDAPYEGPYYIGGPYPDGSYSVCEIATGRVSALLAASASKAKPQQPIPPADTLTARLQQQCSDWGAYWRASDAHGVDLTQAQAVDLLREALGVEVAIKPDRDALRYQWHKARNPGALLAIAWGASREACAEGVDVDRATDVAMGDPFPERTARPAMPMRWVRMEEGPPPENMPVLVWIVSTPGNPGYAQLDEWHEHREDPTGMGGPTLSFGYTWRESDPSEVTHWALVEGPKS